LSNLGPTVNLYQERWLQMRHLDNLDLRYLVLAATGVMAAAGVIDKVPDSPSTHLLVGLLGLVACMGAFFTTAHNRVSMLLALHSINELEKWLDSDPPSVFPWAGGFSPPTSFRAFSKGLLLSIRGPLLILYFSGAAGILAFIGHRSWLRHHSVPKGISVGGAFVIVICYAIWVLWRNYSALGRQLSE